MGYHYEELGPDRFQHLCQALLVKEFPETQCFPVGERDGGRDAVQYGTGRSGKNRIFQVKFARNPFSVRDSHKWVIDTLKGELKKIKEIVNDDASVVEYVLITNVKGTAYPDSGSIDTLNSLLEEEIEVPIRAWWRDDLDRRCDGATDIKWSYPEILKATDLLWALSGTSGNERHERRVNVLRAFASEQYEDDNEVRFKQVDLSNEITNLFVDVPVITSSDRFDGKRKGIGRRSEFRKSVESAYVNYGEMPRYGAAEVFLENTTLYVPNVVVLQGGPGQGKSTLAQYVCQVHRMKILGKVSFADLPEEHKAKAARFPIKVDLREYATWISGKNPFSLEFSEARPPNSTKSLESFISFLISQKSGGQSFDPDDFSAVARSSALLLVLDGLDEIADVKLRNEAVREIASAYRRLADGSNDLRFLITTRPSALAEVNQFPSRIFYKWTLSSLTPELIERYAELWSSSRRLPSNEYGMLKRVLTEKLNQSHMRDLARNPMQLAILLSVIHSRGSSLPDKRTALYDIYVDLFLAREAEKSEIVRRHQEILIDVHRYIAWTLHSEAETGGTLGKIEAARLRDLLSDYLIAEGRDPGIANDLFTGLAQRVVFLVGVVEGIFEFEVQPLREYFAAKFLYETAPYSPAGNPRKGTKDDRFDAIARSAHWLNVTRFYAGCFSKGELPSLVDRLEELSEDEDHGITSQPLTLAATLVADWVFSQNARSLRKVIDLILNEDGYRSLIMEPQPHSENFITLPDGCGRRDIVEKCFNILSQDPLYDMFFSVCRLVKANSNKVECKELWLSHLHGREKDAEFVRKWLIVSQYLGVLNSLEVDEVVDILRKFEVVPSRYVIPCVLTHNNSDDILKSLGFLEKALEGIAQGRYLGGIGYQRGAAKNYSHMVALAVSKFYLHSAPSDARTSVAGWIKRSRGVSFERIELDGAGGQFFDSLIARFLQLSEGKKMRDVFQEGGDYESYVNDSFESSGGRFWELWMMGISYAVMAPRAKRADFSCESIFHGDGKITEKMRYARLQAGNLSWWKRQFAEASSDVQKQLCALSAVVFCGPATLSKLIPAIDSVVEGLSSRDADRFANSLSSTFAAYSNGKRLRVGQNLSEISLRLVAMLSSVAHGSAFSVTQVARRCRSYSGNDPIVLGFMSECVATLFHSGPGDWQLLIDLARKSHRANSRSVLPSYFFNPTFSMPIEIARSVANDKSSYPSYLLREAEARIKRDLADRSEALSVIAGREGWFEEEG